MNGRDRRRAPAPRGRHATAGVGPPRAGACIAGRPHAPDPVVLLTRNDTCRRGSLR